MTTLFQSFIRRLRTLAVLLLGGYLLASSFAAPAAADNTYIIPDGQDITAMVECIPKELSKGDLKRAIAESGKDYLERVFRTKDNYSDYDITAADKEFQACLKSKGITPEAQKS